MTNYYVISYDDSAKGCPVLLKGDLNHDWQWNIIDTTTHHLPLKFEYEYKSKNPFINFDFWNNNIIASENFTTLCDSFGAKTWQISLRIQQSNKQFTDKTYYYLLWQDWLSILDFEKSEYEIDRDLATGEAIYSKHFPDVMQCESITKFVVNEKKAIEKHVFCCIDLDGEVVCDEVFRAACIEKKLIGLKFIPLETFTRIPFWKL
jgi:hypothetical protein